MCNPSQPAPDVSGAEEVEKIRVQHDNMQRTKDFSIGFFTDDAFEDAHADRATLLRLLDAAREKLAEISAWTDDDQRGLNAAVADTMWHWDTRAERPLDPDDAVSLTEALKIHLKDNGFQIVRLATALAKDATT
jgi:predicted ATPase